MTRKSLGALIVLNLVLLLGLAAVTVPTPQAEAQVRRGSAYIMIAGQVTGRDSQNAVYITELNSGKMAAMFFNGANEKVEWIAGRDLTKDTGRGGSGR